MTKSRGFGGKVRVRITRAWGRYRKGEVIAPPAALRQQLLQTTDQLGNRVAEVVEAVDAIVETRPDEAAPGEQIDGQGLEPAADEPAVDAETGVDQGPTDEPTKKAGRPRKGAK